MDKETKIMKLANEAVELIKEYRRETAIVCGGDNILQAIEIKESGRRIRVLNIYDDEFEYDLSEISNEFRKELRGFGPMLAGFYEATEAMRDNAAYHCRDMSKYEIIQYLGEIGYAELKAEQIYGRLQEIDKEAESLL